MFCLEQLLSKESFHNSFLTQISYLQLVYFQDQYGCAFQQFIMKILFSHSKTVTKSDSLLTMPCFLISVLYNFWMCSFTNSLLSCFILFLCRNCNSQQYPFRVSAFSLYGPLGIATASQMTLTDNTSTYDLPLLISSVLSEMTKTLTELPRHILLVILRLWVIMKYRKSSGLENCARLIHEVGKLLFQVL